jgi:hypothetical protein
MILSIKKFKRKTGKRLSLKRAYFDKSVSKWATESFYLTSFTAIKKDYACKQVTKQGYQLSQHTDESVARITPNIDQMAGVEGWAIDGDMLELETKNDGRVRIKIDTLLLLNSDWIEMYIDPISPMTRPVAFVTGVKHELIALTMPTR